MMIDLNDLQERLAIWQKQNFPPRPLSIKEQHMLRMALGICEEAGEVAHVILKGSQGIRSGKYDYDYKEIADGCIDCFIFSLQLLTAIGVDIEKELIRVSEDVILKRDWIKFPGNGEDR